MPSSSAVHTFSDPDDYAASLSSRGASVEVTVTKRGGFEAKHIRINLHLLWMQRCFNNLPQIAHMTASGRTAICFRTLPGPKLLRNGLEVGFSNIIRGDTDGEFFCQSDGSVGYGAMSLPTEELASAGAAIAGCDLTPPKNALSVVPSPLALAKLRNLHAAAGQLAEHAPTVIAHPEAARGLQQALIEALVGCLGTGEVGNDRAALGRHAAIMRRFRIAIEEKLDQALFIPELCTAIGVSHRTLLACCQEQLGMNVKRYLLLRRMHLARRRLRESASTVTTVTEIAARYGFWEFGRFAGEYKSLFGELPSTTLARPSE